MIIFNLMSHSAIIIKTDLTKETIKRLTNRCIEKLSEIRQDAHEIILAEDFNDLLPEKKSKDLQKH